MNVSVKERVALRAMRELLADPARWTQGALARTVHGWNAHPEDPDAFSFCLDGAAHRFGGREYLNVLLLLTSLCGDSVSDFNDRATHQQVLDLLDRAIGEAND